MNISEQLEETLVNLSPGEKVRMIGDLLDAIQREADDLRGETRRIFNIPVTSIDPFPDHPFYILIDCMPSLGMITINALTAADSVIIPVQAQFLPAKGMTQLLRSIDMVRNHTNDRLQIGGIVMTLVDGRTNLAKEVIDTIRMKYGMHIKILDTQIPAAVKAAEASKAGQSIFEYDRGSRPALAYEQLTKEVMRLGEREKCRDETAVTR